MSGLRFAPWALFAALLMVAGAVYFAGGLPAVVLAAPGADEGFKATIDPGAGTEHLGPSLWVRLVKHANGETVPVASKVKLGAFTNVTLEVSLADAIDDAGGSHVSGDVWSIPTAEVLDIVQREDVLYAALEESNVRSTLVDHARLDGTLNDVVRAFDGGVSASSAAQYVFLSADDSVVVDVRVPDESTADTVRT